MSSHLLQGCNPLITLFQNEPRDLGVALSEPMLTPFFLMPEMILPKADIAIVQASRHCDFRLDISRMGLSA
jgi:hypothetical protein